MLDFSILKLEESVGNATENATCSTIFGEALILQPHGIVCNKEGMRGYNCWLNFDFGGNMVKIETRRLILREFEDEDWASVHEYAKDPEVSKYMEWGPNTEKETRNFVKGARHCRRDDPRRHYELAICQKEDKRLIGGCGLTIFDAPLKQAALGYTLHRNYWNQGIASEAAAAMIRYGFEQLGLHRIHASCDVQNIGSAAVMKKCGMRQEGHFLEERLIKGKWRDTFLYAILSSEWRARQVLKNLSAERGSGDAK